VQVSSSYDWSLKCCEVLFNLIVFDALEQICWDNHPQFEIVITLDYFIKKWSNPNSLGGYLSPLSPWNEENAWKVRLCLKEYTRNGCEKLSENFAPSTRNFTWDEICEEKVGITFEYFRPGQNLNGYVCNSSGLRRSRHCYLTIFSTPPL
jgi:hypothetical protein